MIANFIEYFKDKPEYELMQINDGLTIFGNEYVETKIYDSDDGQRVYIANVEIKSSMIAFFHTPQDKQQLFKLLDYFLLQKPL